MEIIVGVILLAVIVWLLFKILKTPLKLVWKLLINALGGFVTLFILNIFGGLVGLTLELNWINAIVTGILGLPGIIILLVIKYI